jgi:hypothetical protein
MHPNLNPAPVDPSVKVPAAVLAAAKRADELLAPPVVEQVPEPEVKAETPPVAEVKPEPAPEPKQEAPLVQEQKVEAKSDDFEQKYRSERGRREKLERQVDGLMDEVHALRQEIIDLRRKPAPTPAPAPAADPGFTPEEEEAYGKDFLSLVTRKAEAIAEQKTANLLKEIAGLKDQMDGVQRVTQVSAHDRLMNRMTELVPDWEQINVNEDFKDWLAEPDAYSGQKRHDMLISAWNAGDAPRCAAFFRGFKQETAAVTPAGNQPARAPEAPKTPLEELAAPGRAKSAAPDPASGPEDLSDITPAYIAKFFTDKAAQRYRGREEEAAKIEAKIWRAQAAGLVPGLKVP